MCSAAYYRQCNLIIANKRADAIGSIGVMVSFIDFSGIMKKTRCYTNHRIMPHQSTEEKNKSFEELLEKNRTLSR
jgi:protease-4